MGHLLCALFYVVFMLFAMLHTLCAFHIKEEVLDEKDSISIVVYIFGYGRSGVCGDVRVRVRGPAP